MPSFTKLAGGDIRCSRFVKLNGTDDVLVESNANERCDGISQEYPHDAQLPGASALAGASGDSIMYYTPGGSENECLLEIGVGGCNAGDRLESDADGKGVTMATTAGTQRNVGAVAMEDADAGGFCRVEVVREIVTHETA